MLPLLEKSPPIKIQDLPLRYQYSSSNEKAHGNAVCVREEAKLARNIHRYT